MLTEEDSESFIGDEAEDATDFFRSKSSDTEEEGVKPSHVTTAAATVILVLLFVEGLLGTTWIILSIVPRRSVWNITNVFVASLCINDLLSLLFIVLLIIDSYAWRRWRAGQLLCRLNPQLTVALTGCSLWHSALIAVHRYLVVVHKKLYNRMSKSAYVIFVLVTTRLVPFACAFAGISPRSSGYVPKLLRCILLPGRPMRMLAVTLVQIVVPSVVVVFCYTVIFLFVLTAARKLSGPRTASIRREIQITKMFGLIFLTILGGFVPYAVVRNLDADNSLNGDVYVVISVFYAIATCSNPIVYGAMSRDIRRACAVLLRDAAVCACGRERGCASAIERFLLSTSGSSRNAEGGRGMERGWMLRGGTTANNATFAVSSQSRQTLRDENGTGETSPLAAAAAAAGGNDADDSRMLDVRREQGRTEDRGVGDEMESGIGNQDQEGAEKATDYEEQERLLGIAASVSRKDDETVRVDDDKMVHEDNDKMVHEDKDKMVHKADGKMVHQDDDKMVHEDNDKMVHEDKDKMVHKADDKMEHQDDDKMAHEDYDKMVHENKDKIVHKDDGKMVHQDDDKIIRIDDDNIVRRPDAMIENESNRLGTAVMTKPGKSDHSEEQEEG